jgi:hypothetical protein
MLQLETYMQVSRNLAFISRPSVAVTCTLFKTESASVAAATAFRITTGSRTANGGCHNAVAWV